MGRTLFVGPQPSSYEAEKSGEVLTPGGALDNIIKMMGIPSSNFFEKFDYINASPHYNPDGFSSEYDAIHMKNIRPLLSGRRIICFGPLVASAFEIDRDRYEWCQFFDHPRWEEFHGLFCVIPYPDNRNRFYHDPENRGMVIRTLEMLLTFSHEENA